MLRHVTVATPHVAGYSLEGRRNGTLIVYRAFCEWAGLPAAVPDPLENGPVLEALPQGTDALSAVLDEVCFVARHDALMRRLERLSGRQRALEFDRLRREYPVRREFQAWTVRCPDAVTSNLLRRLGFHVNQTD
jgi:erythronate-4-phosphate dehydrogenase